MKNLLLIAGAFAVVVLGSTTAFAREAEPADDRGSDKAIEMKSNMPVPGNDDVLEMEANDMDDLDDAAEIEDQEESMGELHKSAVARAVAELNAAADRDGGIGEEVRMLAEEQGEVHIQVAERMDKVSKRGSFVRFFIGSDYTSLGEIRSALVTSENGIDVLRKVRSNTTPEIQAALDSQIDILEVENANARAFIEDQEGAFSLFGWLVKLL
jgi:hypothetical protein